MRKRVTSSSRALFENLESRRMLSVSGAASNGGDFNGDGAINSVDFNILAANWGKNVGPSGGDANGDGVVDSIDFNVVATNFGKSAQVTPPTSPPIAGTWNQIFNDDFNTNPLSRGYVQNIWGLDTDSFGAHWNDATNLKVNNGILSLTATRQAAGGKDFTSAQIASGGDLATGGNTSPLLSFKYGYIEARMQVPDAQTGQGLWPAFWMMPTPNPDYHDGDGEIDIIDNGSGDPTNVTIGVGKHGTHFGGDNKADLSGGYHTIGLDWQPDHIDWYLDGVRFAHDTDLSTIPTVEEYFILGLQVCDGVTWGPAPDSSTVLPNSLNVDYVRVWQKTSAPAAAQSTLSVPGSSLTGVASDVLA